MKFYKEKIKLSQDKELAANKVGDDKEADKHKAAVADYKQMQQQVN